MKTPKLNKALFAISLTLAFSMSTLARAELVRQSVQEQTITQESAGPEDLLDAPSAAPTQQVVVVQRPQQAELRRDWQMPPRQVVIAQNEQGIGSKIDGAITKKIDQVRNQMEDSLVKAVEGIKLNASIGETQPAPQQVVVQDRVSTVVAAPEAPEVIEAVVEKPAPKSALAIMPLLGTSSFSSDTYNIDARYSVGVGLEADIDEHISMLGSFMYSQYDIGLAGNSAYSTSFTATNPQQGNSLRTLEYNQNVIDVGMRYYVMPKESRYRVFVGGGVAYNKGFLNYKQSTLNAFTTTPTSSTGTSSLEDYEVTSFLGMMETGGEVQLSKAFSVGAAFRYHSVLSSRENAPLNNNAFVGAAAASTITPADKSVVGGSIRDESFYSLLGSVKVSF